MHRAAFDARRTRTPGLTDPPDAGTWIREVEGKAFLPPRLRVWLRGDQMDLLIDELNRELVA